MSLRRFQLVLEPWLGPPASDRYVALGQDPPAGCVVREPDSDQQRMYLDCERVADHRLQAIARSVVEIRNRHGLADADDLGIEKLPSMAR